MKIHSIVLVGAALLAPPAFAANLTVVKVAAPAVNCVFNASCTSCHPPPKGTCPC